ncbi:ANKL1 protein, partial [Amia calva]|nr:ANKL1 protein [Amia calva]
MCFLCRKVEALLIQRANPNLVLSKGAAAVHLAAGKETEKRIRCLRLLLQYGADPNVRSVDGLTPLHIAALWGCYQNLKLLLQNGGDANLEDQDGNKAADLADEQENRKCAQLLQEYQSYDTCAIPCDLSLLSDCPEGPLSSTRRSSQHSAYLNLSAISARPSVGGRCRRSGQSDLSDLAWRHTQTWRRDSEGGGEPQSVLSSTRISTAGGIGVLPVLQEDLPLSNCSFHPKPLELAESHSQPPTEESSPAADETFDISEYSEFLDLERMATVLNFQGIDVTSPDHVFVFSRDAGSVSPDLDKTLVGHWPIEEEEADEEPEEIDTPVQPPPCSSSSSGSSGSRYSSCDSEPYTSAVEGSLHHRLASVVEEESSDRGQEILLSSKLQSTSRASEEEEQPLMLSPFVTGRTRSRLSRCSLRANGSSILSSPSFLFDETLPTPTRLRRRTTKKHGDERLNSDGLGSSLSSEFESSGQTQTSLLEGNSIMEGGGSQDDTVLIPGSLADTVILEREESNSCSSDDSPESQRDLPATPGAGYTPRYSVSRLSACHQPQRLADLSYTPGGRPLIPEVEEPVEYLYTDTEEGHELIECHVPPTANHTLSSDVTSSEDTVLYDWKSFHASPGKGKENQLPQEEVPSAIHKLPDRELRRQLQELGEEPGPINKTTRLIYMQQLCRLQHKQPKHNPGYSPELAASMHTFQLPDCRAHELALCQQFDQPDQNRKWREGVIKSSFNYLLLDPRVTTNLPSRSVSMHPAECFQTFIKAIFYVGKGKRSRPYSHLYEALEYYRGDRTSKKLCSKVQHILQVWATGQGVISLHCFQNVIPVEAYTREACMVDAMGLKMLTNKKRGDYYGVVATWPMKQRRELGVHLLYRAMLIFLAEGERQLRPADLRAA